MRPAAIFGALKLFDISNQENYLLHLRNAEFYDSRNGLQNL